jgi:hypothetical protein
MQATVVKDYPRMIMKVDNKKWQKFFIDEAEKLKNDILS